MFVQISRPNKGRPDPLNGLYASSWLMEEKDGLNELLAVEFCFQQRQYYGAGGKSGPEDRFDFAFANDAFFGESRHSPRTRGINREKEPWEFEKRHMVTHWCVASGLPGHLVRQAGGDYISGRLLAPTPEKLEELIREFKLGDVERKVMGSRNLIVFGKSHKLMGKGNQENAQAFYLYGPTPQSARKKFYPVLGVMEIPMLPEWDDYFWDLFRKAGWVSALSGQNMAGYRIELNRENICTLISDEIRARRCPKPDSVPADLWV